MWRWMRARSACPRGPPKRPHTIQKAGGRADLPNLPEAPQRHGTRRPTPDRTAAPRSHLVRDGVRQSRAATLTVREQARNQRSTPAKSKRCSYRERETCGATAAASGRGASRAAQVTSWAEAREPSRLRRRRVAVQGHLAGQRDVRPDVEHTTVHIRKHRRPRPQAGVRRVHKATTELTPHRHTTSVYDSFEYMFSSNDESTNGRLTRLLKTRIADASAGVLARLD
jgi:hypothetical protein